MAYYGKNISYKYKVVINNLIYITIIYMIKYNKKKNKPHKLDNPQIQSVSRKSFDYHTA